MRIGYGIDLGKGRSRLKQQCDKDEELQKLFVQVLFTRVNKTSLLLGQKKFLRGLVNLSALVKEWE